MNTDHLGPMYSEIFYVSSKVYNIANVQVQVDFVRNKRGGQSLVLGGYIYMISTLIT